ncbi:hypothetical protein LJC31_08190 [Synergistaceae bacterium OttesenSCG-928-I11]|nr:hypothetical protein [Synergistaceae bacterium OttesenSCG-928-I11]
MTELFNTIEQSMDGWLDKAGTIALHILAMTAVIGFGIGIKDLVLAGNLSLDGTVALFVRFAFIVADSNFKQLELFDEGSYEARAKFERLARATDKINAHLGRRAVFPAVLARKDGCKWKPAKNMASAGEITI